MKNPILIILVISFSIISFGCNKSSEKPVAVTYPYGADLLGLNRDHQLRYVIFDSLVTFYPDYSVDVDTTFLNIDIISGQNNQVQLAVNDTARDLLTIDNIGVLHSGQIRLDATPPDTLFFVPTPVILPRSYSIGSTLYITTPPFVTDTGEIRTSFLNLNYGFFTERTFIERSEVILPTSSYNAYHFRSHIFLNELSTDTLMTVDEYYADNVGLVMLASKAAATQRLIILLADN
ncbi:MAG: hypothetical protein V3V99_09410 [candidate division Zixibacteria bacterium]